MESDLTMDGLDFEGRGYFACPREPTGAMNDSEDAYAWRRWLEVFWQAADKGDFSGLGRIAAMRRRVHDPAWQGVACHLVGDAAPDDVAEAIMRRMWPYGPIGDAEYALDQCRVLRGWGRLDAVPVLLDTWRSLADWEDALIIPVWLSQLLESAPGPLGDPGRWASVDAYYDAVLARFEDRAAKFGGTGVHILLGARFGVNRIAERIRQQAREPYFSPFLRQSFEASTGIDCSDFYEGGVLQMMPTLRKMEAFLDSPATEKFEDGKRYFFGHQID